MYTTCICHLLLQSICLSRISLLCVLMQSNYIMFKEIHLYKQYLDTRSNAHIHLKVSWLVKMWWKYWILRPALYSWCQRGTTWRNYILALIIRCSGIFSKCRMNENFSQILPKSSITLQSIVFKKAIFNISLFVIK